MGEKKKKKEGKKGIILKGVLFFFICVLLLLGATAFYAFLRIGSAPSESEKAFFAKLPNYKNGKFLIRQKPFLSFSLMAEAAVKVADVGDFQIGFFQTGHGTAPPFQEKRELSQLPFIVSYF